MDNPVFAAALIGIAILGVCFNLAVSTAMAIAREQLRKPPNVVLFALAVGDCLAAAVDVAILTTSATGGEWLSEHRYCDWYAWLMATLSMFGVGLVALLAVLRCISVTQPERRITIRHSLCWIAAVLALALILASLPWIGWGSHGLDGFFYVPCDLAWKTRDPSTGSATYALVLLVFVPIIPLLVQAACDWKIFCELREVRQRLGIPARPEEARLTKMMGMMILGFLASWSPYVAGTISIQCFQVTIPPSLASLAVISNKLSGCSNPIIYVALNRQFQAAVIQRFGSARDRAVGITETRC